MKKVFRFLAVFLILTAFAAGAFRISGENGFNENDVIFFGDSTTAHMKLRGGIPESRVWSGKANTVLFRTVCEGKLIYLEDEDRAVSLAEAVR